MTLGQRIREIVGPCVNSSGRGNQWLYVDYPNRGSKVKSEKLIYKLTNAFETWSMVRRITIDKPAVVFVDWFFIVKSKRGVYLGIAHVSGDYLKGSYLIVDMIKGPKDVVHRHNSNYKDVVSYQKVEK